MAVERRPAPHAVRARATLLLALLPIAREGLLVAGVDADESERYLELFEARVRSGQTGAVWQRNALGRLQPQGGAATRRSPALLDRYIAGFDSQQPVHAWGLDPPWTAGHV